MNGDTDHVEHDATGKFHTVQPHRDLQSNWAVDLAKSLEEYLLKICSGEITSGDNDTPHLSVNFAEGLRYSYVCCSVKVCNLVLILSFGILFMLGNL